ncbi:hypothetical protein PS15m_005660 [Mucor circinelloides]
MDNAQSTETNVVEAVEVPTVVRCRYCNRKGNSRRTYFNCAMNPAFVINAQPRDNIARNHDLQECVRNDIGTMDTACVSCGAYMWIAERTTKSSNSQPQFQLCCSLGDVKLPHESAIPDVLARLFKSNDNDSKEFKKKH